MIGYLQWVRKNCFCFCFYQVFFMFHLEASETQRLRKHYLYRDSWFVLKDWCTALAYSKNSFLCKCIATSLELFFKALVIGLLCANSSALRPILRQIVKCPHFHIPEVTLYWPCDSPARVDCFERTLGTGAPASLSHYVEI